jgi:hypothetical protein
MAAAVVVVVPAGAITDGELDGNGHPAVVLVLMEVNGAPAFRCTGTLIAPTFVITAGHCAGEPGEFSGIRVFAEADVQHDPTIPVRAARTPSKRPASRRSRASPRISSSCTTSG